MLLSLVLNGLLAASAAVAMPLAQDKALMRRQGADAPYTVDTATLAAAITCPKGYDNTKGLVILMHGTGSTGAEIWEAGPYNQLLPKDGYAVCWITAPDRALDDAQITSEYVAYAITTLAPHSVTGKVGIVGHSQGAGTNIQWALLYWPSTRALVSRYVGLGADFHGSIEGPLLCTTEDIARGGCAASIFQQSTGSNMLTAQNKRGGVALVPTTSIYSLTDELIIPELVNPSSALTNADNIYLQQLNVCGPLQVSGHWTLTVHPAAYAIAKLALSTEGTTPLNKFKPLACTYFLGEGGINFNESAVLAEGIAVAVINAFATGPIVPQEPKLMPYVCAAGDAPASQCA